MTQTFKKKKDLQIGIWPFGQGGSREGATPRGAHLIAAPKCKNRLNLYASLNRRPCEDAQWYVFLKPSRMAACPAAGHS